MLIVGNKCDKESEREVGTDELISLADGAPGCGFVESSAKKNVNIEEIFVKLFCLGKLPTEMSPSMHRKVQPSYVPGKDSKEEKSNGGGSPSGSFRKGVSIRRRLSDACGAVAPNARRPSIRTDLLILQTQRSLHGGSLDETGRDRDNKCSVQWSWKTRIVISFTFSDRKGRKEYKYPYTPVYFFIFIQQILWTTLWKTVSIVN